jgi:MscS family membrane protein
VNIPPEIIEVALRIGLAALVFVLIWLLRHLVARLVLTPLRRLAERTPTQADNMLYDILERPVGYVTLAFAIDISTRILALDPNASLFVARVTRTIIVFAVFLGLYRTIDIYGFSRSRLFSITGIGIDDQLLPFVRTGLQFIVFAITVIIVIQVWGYDVTGLVAGLGLGGLAFSLAAQETISNLFGFSMIVGDRPFVVGEFIKTPDVEGVVEHVGLRSTRVRQSNQALVSVPNSRLASSTILNWSRLSKRWIDFTLKLNYRARPEQIHALLEQLRTMLAAREPVDKESIVVHFINFGDTSLEILIRAYLMLPNWLDFTREREAINFEIMRMIDELGLELAFPSQTLHIENFPTLANDPRQMPEGVPNQPRDAETLARTDSTGEPS